MTAKGSAEHVIWDNMPERSPLTLLPDQQFVLRCLHCGDRYVLALPASLSLTAAVCKQYGKEHRRCKPRRTEP